MAGGTGHVRSVRGPKSGTYTINPKPVNVLKSVIMKWIDEIVLDTCRSYKQFDGIIRKFKQTFSAKWFTGGMNQLTIWIPISALYDMLEHIIIWKAAFLLHTNHSSIRCNVFGSKFT